jgi:hypothetical protein
MSTANPPAVDPPPIDAFAIGADGRLLVARGGTLALAAPGEPTTPLTLTSGPEPSQFRPSLPCPLPMGRGVGEVGVLQ